MKNVTRIIALSFTCLLASCASDQPVGAEPTPDAPVANEVEVVRVETSAPENSTEVSFGKNGASVTTKDGEAGTKIEVKGGSANIEVKGN